MQTRNYLYDIDLLLSQFIQEPDTIIKIVKKTASGALNNEIQRFITEATTPVNWATIKRQIEKTFLSSDDAEVLRQNMRWYAKILLIPMPLRIDVLESPYNELMALS